MHVISNSGTKLGNFGQRMAVADTRSSAATYSIGAHGSSNIAVRIRKSVRPALEGGMTSFTDSIPIDWENRSPELTTTTC